MEPLGNQLTHARSRLTNAGFDRAALDRLPTAESLASDILTVDPRDPDFAAPAITNQWSGVVVGREPFGYSGFSSPEVFHAGAQGELYIREVGGPPRPATEVFESLSYRWFPSRVERDGVTDDLRFQVETSLSVTAQALLNHLVLTNQGQRAKSLDLFMVVHTDVDAKWEVEFPPEQMLKGSFENHGDVLVVAGPQRDAFGMVASSPAPDSVSGVDGPGWQEFLNGEPLETSGPTDAPHALLRYRVELEPGAGFELRWVHALAVDLDAGLRDVKRVLESFDEERGETRSAWEAQWRAAFSDEAVAFSGHAPVVTSANPKLERLYYMGVMTLLQCKRTPHFGSQAQVYITGFPSSLFTFPINWAFPWDIKMVSGILSLLDPAVMKGMISAWLEADLHQGCAIDFRSRKPVGFWYAVNDYALIHMVWQYLRYTGDTGFLDENVRDRPVLSHLKDAALYYQRIAGDDGLADYGGANNLLECVSTYTNKVASFNAANVWNLRIVAGLLEDAGRGSEAGELLALADAMVIAVQDLYVPGDGVWSCKQPDGSKVVVRHCLDFHTVAQCLRDDLSAEQRAEMVAFFLRELKTETWMHALSPLDPDTAHSSRTDHQDEGAYTTWPAYAFEVLMQEGHEAEALAWLGNESQPGFADVTRQGPFGQAYTHGDAGSPRLAGAGAKAPMEMPHIEKPTLVSGGKYAQIVIEAVAGLAPLVNGPVELEARDLAAESGGGLQLSNLLLRGADHGLVVGQD